VVTHAEPGSKASRARPRRPLSRERVLRTAIELADARGLEALSMRKLAQAIGVEAMTLYHWVTNKDEMIDGIVDLVLGEFRVPTGGEDWKTELRTSIVSAHEALERHPWACPFLMTPRRLRPARLEFIDAVLRQLAVAGLSAELIDHAYHALDSHLLGSTLWEAGYAAGGADGAAAAQAALISHVMATYPALAEHVEYHLRPRREGEPSDFEFGLNLILDGVERLDAATRIQAAV
jgi:AcrR family transcriptional regulator